MLDVIEQIGSFAGLAAFLGLGVFALLSFAHGRDLRRLREWAGSAPERDAERKETTSTIAAQRAEELRRLEESRTAEHEAVSEREERRRRREQGLPEVPRGERLRGSLAGLGERLAEPKWLVALFVVMALVVAGVGYALLSGGDDGAQGSDQRLAKKQAVAKVNPSEVEVAIFNGTEVAGLAATYGDRVQNKGFELGAVGNTAEPVEASVVMFARGHRPEAKKVAKQLRIPTTQLMTGEIETGAEGANVAVIVGEDDAAEAG